MNTISNHLIQFCRFLRDHDFSPGPQEEQYALEALQIIPYTSPKHFKNALRSTLTKNKNQVDRFDDLYLQYWSEIRKAGNSKLKEVAAESVIPRNTPQKSGVQVIKEWLEGHKEKEEVFIASYDDSTTFTEQNFSSFRKDDLREAVRQAAMLVKKLSNKKGRRYVNVKSKMNLDLRKVMRSNIGRTEELIHLNFRKKKVEKLKLVLICDVSRSMELYSRFLIQFMYGLNNTATKIETFVFSTELERITKSLVSDEFAAVLEALKSSFSHWSAGTRIGHSLSEFIDFYGMQMLDHRTKIIILSDGWDTGDPEMVEEAMANIKRRSSKIIWLNPLAGNPSFKPETACLKAALPYVDHFQGANTVKDLSRLVSSL